MFSKTSGLTRTAIALVFAGMISSAPAAAKPEARNGPPADWSKVVTDTGTGWRMGDAKAPVQLVEYGSFNCAHCAAFAKDAMPAIRKLVAERKISFEFRPKQIFPHDPAATILAQCVGKARVFAFTDDYMANAPDVLGKLRAAYKIDAAKIDTAEAEGTASAAPLMASLGDMATIAKRHGVEAARATACLADKTMIARVDTNEAAAIAAGVKSTPTFFIDGQPATMEGVAALGIPVAH